MAKFESPLDNIRIASPCSEDWDEMFGNERKRFCGECRLNVYNLSGLTREEAESLLITSEERVCVRYFQRADGTILTSDCPVGLAKLKQRVSLAATAFISLLISFFGAVFVTSNFVKYSTVKSAFPTIPAFSPEPRPLMGAVRVNPDPGPKKESKPDNKKFDAAKEKVLKQAGA